METVFNKWQEVYSAFKNNSFATSDGWSYKNAKNTGGNDYEHISNYYIRILGGL